MLCLGRAGFGSVLAVDFPSSDAVTKYGDS